MGLAFLGSSEATFLAGDRGKLMVAGELALFIGNRKATFAPGAAG
jgi:hypothetical protein